jgi:hypothetical protein
MMTQMYQILGIVKHVKRNPGEDKGSVIRLIDYATQKEIKVSCPFFCPTKKDDIIAGFSILHNNNTLTFAQCPMVEPPSSKEAVQNVFIIGMGKLRISQYMADKVYDFFKDEAIERIKRMPKVVDKGSSESTIFRNRDSLNAAVIETISWYANSFRTDEFTAQPLINLGLSKEQAHQLLQSWYRSYCLRRLYLLGLTRKEIRECCDRGWVGTKGVVNSPDALYYQLLENPFIPEKIPIDKAKDIAVRYGLTFGQDIIECADLIRYVDEQTSKNGSVCFPVFQLIRRYPRFNELTEILKTQFKCCIRYNFFYLRYQAETEDNLTYYLQSTPLPETHASDMTKLAFCDEQIRAIEMALNNSVSLITGSAGCGKCLHPDTPILIADGSTKCAKDIVVEDMLIGDDSTIRNVLSICSGEDNMYQIIPSKGKPFICNEPHILTLKGIKPYISIRSNRNLQYTVYYTFQGNSKTKGFMNELDAHLFMASLPEDVFDIPLNEYLKKCKTFKRNTFLYHVGVNFAEQPVEFDPYIIGLWLGDGSSDGTAITNVDQEIITYLTNKVTEYGLTLRLQPSTGITYNITGTGVDYGIKGGNMFLTLLKKLNMLKNKHIPNVYKLNSRENRLKLLAGLIDSDGYNHGNCIEISQKSDQLADDIEYLAFSLGFMVTRTRELKWCIYNEQVSEGFYHRLCIFGEGLEDIPVLLERKKCHPRISKIRAGCYTFEVIPMGRGQYSGFTLDGNGRFLLGDFLVTHNTKVISGIVNELDMREIPWCIGSFTGKAVANVKKVVRKSDNIMTLHMILSKGKIVDNFNRPVKVLIIDEVSMIFNELVCKVILKLTHALDPEQKLQIILVGDPNQLQPIESGDFTNQIVSSLSLPWIQLIIDHRRKTKDGVLFNNMNQFAFAERPEDIDFQWGADCEFIKGGIVEVENCVRNLWQQGVKSDEFVVLSPINDGLDDINTRVKNIYISPNAPSIDDAFGKTWNTGDRIMMTTNRYDIKVMNGEEGIITDVIHGKSCIKVLFENGQEVSIPTFIPVIIENAPDSDEPDYEQPLSTKLIKLSWGITVHKSQGSQYKNVIFYLHHKVKGGSFFNRPLLYVGAGRAQERLIVIAQYESTFTTAILIDAPKRYDNLSKRLTNEEFVDHYVDPNFERNQQMYREALARTAMLTNG